MWCAKCHADVAAEVTPDNARARCATCRTELGLAAAVRAADKTREARELLQRWSSHRSLDPYGPLVPPQPTSTVPDAVSVRDGSHAGLESTSASRGFRVDAAHPQPRLHQTRRSPDPEPREREHARDELRPASRPAIDERPPVETSHAPDRPRSLWRRFIDVQSAIHDAGPERTNWFHLAGHLLAYSGALVLTLGTALVLVGYFGGPQKAHYAPTGWLIATFGQLLLVSGVITLVSSGMERTSQEVSSRIDALGEKLLRFEQRQTGAAAVGTASPRTSVGRESVLT